MKLLVCAQNQHQFSSLIFFQGDVGSAVKKNSENNVNEKFVVQWDVEFRTVNFEYIHNYHKAGRAAELVGKWRNFCQYSMYLWTFR